MLNIVGLAVHFQPVSTCSDFIKDKSLAPNGPPQNPHSVIRKFPVDANGLNCKFLNCALRCLSDTFPNICVAFLKENV